MSRPKPEQDKIIYPSIMDPQVPIRFIDPKAFTLLETTSSSLPYLPRVGEFIQFQVPSEAYKGVHIVGGVFYEFSRVGVLKLIRYVMEPVTRE